MTNLNGGYIIIAKNDADAYAKANKALTLGKPILFYEDNTTCYYIDTIALDGTDVLLTKGGKTIKIESDGDITETGDIQNHLYQYTITFSADYNEGSINTTFKLKFISNKSNITIDDLINDNDVISQYQNTILVDYENNGGNIVFTIIAFDEDNSVNIIDTDAGDNTWIYSDLVIDKITLF